jgi:colanic acid/amylovoran biosynthesis glycosyltransferase
VLDYLPYYLEMVRRLNPAVLHAHYGPVGAALVGLRRKTNVPLVTSFYGIDASALLHNDYYKKAYPRLWQECDIVSVLSQNMKDALAEAGCPEEKIRIHHLAVDTGALAPLPNLRPAPGGPIRISCVCRLVEKKGLDTLIRAVTIARKQVDVELDIAGSGPLDTELRELIDKLDATQFVHLHGRLHRPQALLLMAGSHFFCLLSRTAADGDMEGTPTALIEAGALGLPSVSTFHAGIPEIISNKNTGLLVPENDPEAASDAIVRIASDPDMRHRLGVNARAQICSEFSIHKVIKQIEADYDFVQI